MYLLLHCICLYTHTHMHKAVVKDLKVTKSWPWPRFVIPWLQLHLPAPSLSRRLPPLQPRLLFKSPCISKLETAAVEIKSATLEQLLQTQPLSHLSEEVTIPSCVINVVCWAFFSAAAAISTVDGKITEWRY